MCSLICPSAIHHGIVWALFDSPVGSFLGFGKYIKRSKKEGSAVAGNSVGKY